MKLKFLLIIFTAILTLNSINSQKNQNLTTQAKSETLPSKSEAILKENFNSFKQKYSKNYSSKAEEAGKFETFKKNLELASALKKTAFLTNPNTKLELGETQFSDLKVSEFNQQYLTLNNTELMQTRTAFLRNLTTSVSEDDSSLRFLQLAPDQYDWSLQGAVSPVKNQGACGSCWAFSTVATIESQFFLKKKTHGNFSEQNLVDCETTSFGCSGGYLHTAFSYAQTKGLMTQALYPYAARKSKCRYKSTQVAVKVHTFAFGASTNEEDIKNLLFANCERSAFYCPKRQSAAVL
jgi:C1A family cysteine protease